MNKTRSVLQNVVLNLQIRRHTHCTVSLVYKDTYDMMMGEENKDRNM